LLNVRDLAMEASQSLGSLLEQLKSPKLKSLSTSMTIVFVIRFVSHPPVLHYCLYILLFVHAVKQISVMWATYHSFIFVSRKIACYFDVYLA
jgi:hypothetical protein